MLETFLELGVAADDIGAAFEEVRSLGFTAVGVGDIRDYAYAVVSDGDVCIALHDRELDEPWLSFVRPELASYARALQRRTIELEFAKLGEQQFHELAFRDPSDQLVTLVEARTFSPPHPEDVGPSVCGRFLEYSLATGSLDASTRFWQGLGLVVVEQGAEPHPWARMQGAGIRLGLHESAGFRPGLTYAASQLGARTGYLRAKGHDVRPKAPVQAPGRPAATLRLGAGLTIYLLEEQSSAD